jgi:hypothetical protein
MTDKEAMAMALEALKEAQTNGDGMEKWDRNKKAIIALEEALAQPEQEPVAWFSPSGNLYKTRFHATANGEQVVTPLYTTPPQRTEQEIVGTVKELFNSVAWEKLNVRGSAKVYLDADALRDAMNPLQSTTAPPAQRTEQKMVMWPCLIDTADFSKGTVTVVMQCEDYKVSAGTHWLSTTPPKENT